MSCLMDACALLPPLDMPLDHPLDTCSHYSLRSQPAPARSARSPPRYLLAPPLDTRPRPSVRPRPNRKTKAEPQWIVATRLLYHVQYPVFLPSSAGDLLLSLRVWKQRSAGDAAAGTLAGARRYVHSARAKDPVVASSTDSGLEAFSHHPADASVAPLAAQPRARTKYLNERFLSY